ncbi:MAG: GntR family transcriptional regulator [Verrucomicrobia bacterium]|nr:GntR family transcriptional regulator [Verrucomicrobiota bacterium]
MSPLQQKALRTIFEGLRGVKVGSPIPSERHLAEHADVTRTVIRGLMASLAKDGVIRRKGRNWALYAPIKPSLLNQASENPVSRRQQVKDYLMSELGRGRLQPGQSITELAIAKKLGVATISVREALLEMMPLGVFSKNKSRLWEVAAFTPTKITMMREFREMVEVYCLRKLIAQGLIPHSRKELEQIRVETQSLVASKAPLTEKILSVDLSFHRFLLEASGNPLITERVEFIYLIIGFQLVSPLYSPEQGRLGLRQHLTIIDDILGGKLDPAEDHLLAHLQSSEETFCSIVKRFDMGKS